MLGQRLTYQPVKDAVPAGHIGDDVPALVASGRNPRRDHRDTEGVHEDGVQLPLCLVGIHTRAVAADGLAAGEFEAPPRSVFGAVEQPHREIPV